jgi:Xaa-Pro aminopeptidase
VEPGLYFINVLLDELLAGPDTKCFAVVERVEALRGRGGCRLEDSVLVTPDGPVVNLTTCPRTCDDVEAVIAGTITHKSQLAKAF